MPRGVAEKVRMRMEELARMLQMYGCVTLHTIKEMYGLTRTQAEVALRHLEEGGRAVRVRVGRRFTLWCLNRRLAVRHLRRLKKVLHMLICNAKMKYVKPGDVFELVLRDVEARRLLLHYISLRKNNANALDALKSLMELSYGEPVTYASGGPVYFVDCRQPPRPLPPSVYKERKQYTIIRVRVGAELREMVERAAAAEGISISALVKRAVERLLERYRRRDEVVLVSIHLPRFMLQALDEYARQARLTRAAVVKMAIEQLLERMRILSTEEQQSAQVAL